MTVKLTDQQWIAEWHAAGGSPAKMATNTGMDIRGIYMRRKNIEARHTLDLKTGGARYNYKPRLVLENVTGSVIIFSDCHWWPDISETVAFKALLEVIKEIKPKLIVGNGDMLDAARISRFGRIGWDNTPKLPEELEDVKERCAEIRHTYRGAQLVRTIGNHDLRYDSWLASKAADFEGIGGFRLSDHLPEWQETMSLWVNGAVIKHRWHGGINAAMNNTMKSGKTMVTGHDHILLVRPYVDYNGMRWGVQDGTLAEPGGPQFAYGEDNPSQATSGFVVLSFDSSGRLLYPEVCEVREGVAYFRGQRVCGKRVKVAA